MGNSAAKTTSPVRRPSLAEREDLRAKKRAILDCLEFASVPLEDQDATCKLLIDGGITDAPKLVDANDAILASLGIKPNVRELLLKAQARFSSMPGKGAETSKASNGGHVMPPLDPNAPMRRKKSIAAGGNLMERGQTRRDSVKANRPAVRLTKFIKGDVVSHYRDTDHLLRKGKVVGVHSDDLVSGLYYTVALTGPYEGRELQSSEKKLEFAGVWEKLLQDQGITPRFTEDEQPMLLESKDDQPATPVETEYSEPLSKDIAADEDLL